MQIIEGELGNFEQWIGPSDLRFQTQLTLNFAPSRVQVLMRGFDIGYDGDDRNLARLRVELEAYTFGVSTQVDVIARITLRDQDHAGELIRAKVFYALLVE